MLLVWLSNYAKKMEHIRVCPMRYLISIVILGLVLCTNSIIGKTQESKYEAWKAEVLKKVNNASKKS